MNIKYTTLIAALIICNIAHPAAVELKESKAKMAAAESSGAAKKGAVSALATAMTDRQQGQWTRDYESLLPAALPAALHDIIKDYYFDEGDVKDAFLSILYRPVGQISDNKEIYHATFADNGKVVVTRADNNIKLWDISGKEIKEIKTLPTTNSIYCLNTSPDGNIIVASLSKNNIHILDTTGTCLDTIKIDEEYLHDIATNNNAQTIVTLNEDKSIKIWNRATKSCTATIPRAHDEPIWGLIIAHDNTILTASWDTTVCLWTWTAEGRAQALAVQHSDGNKLKGHRDAIHALTINHDHTLIATGSTDNTARLWNRSTGECLVALPHKTRIMRVCIRPDGKIITESDHGLLQVWDWDQKTNAGTCIAKLTPRKQPWVHVLAISPDGNTFVTGSYNEHIASCSDVYRFDKDNQQILYKLSLASLIKLKQLTTELGKSKSRDMLLLSKEQGAFLFSLPAILQRNILEHFGITETQQQFEKRTSEDRKSNT